MTLLTLTDEDINFDNHTNWLTDDAKREISSNMKMQFPTYASGATFCCNQ